MSKVVKFFKDWQAITDQSARTAEQLAKDPKFARQFNLMNWLITVVMCIGLLYAFMA